MTLLLIFINIIVVLSQSYRDITFDINWFNVVIKKILTVGCDLIFTELDVKLLEIKECINLFDFKLFKTVAQLCLPISNYMTFSKIAMAKVFVFLLALVYTILCTLVVIHLIA